MVAQITAITHTLFSYSLSPLAIGNVWKQRGEYIQLWFNAASGQSGPINFILEGLYPNVNSFNCPDE
jgi:hypothetical protein